MTRRPRRHHAAALVLPLATAALALGAGPALAAKRTQLTGLLALSPGKAIAKPAKNGPKYTGSYFRMLLPGATDRYFTNANSNATADKTYTLFVPGTDGGLRLGAYQQPPTPAFSSNGFALASRIVRPEPFAGIKFSISTAPRDAQTNARDPVPTLYVTGNKITGNLSAWIAEWNSIYFNQGSPKPGGAYPGLTRPVNGTYNPKTRAFEITWYSLIVGGPFNGFTGYWHLQGKVKPAA